MSTFIKFATLITIAAALGSSSSFGQSAEALNQQIGKLFQQGKFADAIPLAEKAVEIEKRTSKTSEQYAIALTNLGVIRKEWVKQLRKRAAELDGNDRRKLLEDATEQGEKAKSIFRDALDVYAVTSKTETFGAASVKAQLAWTIHNFVVLYSIAKSREQIDEAERLFSESIATQERLGAADSDLLMRTVLDFADFYMKYVNFEKALPLYAKYSSAVERKYGGNSKGLVPALRAYKEIFSITERPDDAKKMAGRIESITGTPEGITPSFPSLTMRSRKIENVKNGAFIPIDFSDPNKAFSYGMGSGAFSPMGRARMNSISVDILVDENGDVVEAKTSTPSKYSKEVETAAMASKFRPFLYENAAYKLRGRIAYSYFDH